MPSQICPVQRTHPAAMGQPASMCLVLNSCTHNVWSHFRGAFTSQRTLSTALRSHTSFFRCEGLDVLFQQRDLARHDWEAVRSGHKTDYAWDQPSGAHKLCVCIKDSSAAFRDMTTHEYSLDFVKVCQLCC